MYVHVLHASTSTHLTYILNSFVALCHFCTCLSPSYFEAEKRAAAENQALLPGHCCHCPEKWTVRVVMILVVAMVEHHLLNQLPVSQKMCMCMCMYVLHVSPSTYFTYILLLFPFATFARACLLPISKQRGGLLLRIRHTFVDFAAIAPRSGQCMRSE